MTYSTQIHLVCVCLLKMHNSHITSWLDIINFLWLCVAEVNPHAKRFWWQGYLFPLKALNLNKINVRTRNWDPTLITEDRSRTKTLQKTYLDRFHRYGILEIRGIQGGDVGCNNATSVCMAWGLSARWNYSNVRFMLISPARVPWFTVSGVNLSIQRIFFRAAILTINNISSFQKNLGRQIQALCYAWR